MYFFRHPFLLYPHFIDHWKKRLNKDGDDFLDDSEFEAMFTDEDEEMEEIKKKDKKKKKHEKEKNVNITIICSILSSGRTRPKGEKTHSDPLEWVGLSE
jgi:hypothetical protein